MRTLIKLEPSPFGYWSCSHKSADSDCDDPAYYGLSAHKEGTARKQYCLAHALEWCYKHGVAFPFENTTRKSAKKAEENIGGEGEHA